MAGWGGVRAHVRRWWDSPATLEVLVTAEGYDRAVATGFLRFGALGVLIGIPALVLTDASLRDTAPLVFLAALPILTLMALAWIQLRSLPRVVIHATVVFVAALVGMWIGFFGTDRPSVAVIVPCAAAVVTVWVPRRWALIAITLGFGVQLAILLARDVDELLAYWTPIAFFTYLVLFELSHMLERVRDLAEQERAAQAEVRRLAAAEHDARVELAELNATLEDRVERQVGEIEGLGRLRQFLSPAVADAVVADSLAPHRRRIAVVFIDLRDFTAFSSVAEPEELLDVLDAYYEVVGAELRTYGATVGSFQGDGIFAYFNDPVPCDDPAGTAVAMALALRDGLDRLVERWGRRGFGLGWGIGIAYGYATLGTIGFDDRRDYTPLGSVVNLASRLCDEAAPGEILLDGRTHHEVDGKVEVEPTTVPLKGYEAPVVAYRA